MPASERRAAERAAARGAQPQRAHRGGTGTPGQHEHPGAGWGAQKPDSGSFEPSGTMVGVLGRRHPRVPDPAIKPVMIAW